MLRRHLLPSAGRGLHTPAWAIPLAAVAFLGTAARVAGKQALPPSPAGNAARTPATPAPDLEKYLAELDRWSTAAAQLKQDPRAAAALAKELPDAWHVTIDGQRFSVPTAWLREDLGSLQSHPGSANRTLDDIKARLDAMRAQTQAFDRERRSGSALESAAGRRTLDEVLKRREFRGLRGPSWFDAVRERSIIWLDDLLNRVFGRLTGHPRASRGLMWVIAIGLALIFMTWLVRAFLDRRSGTVLDLKGPFGVTRGSRDWAREAVEASRRGDYREAVRFAYWAGVYRLAELGFWQVDRTRTHREYLDLLPHAPDDQARRSALTEATFSFERIWYGRQPASADDFQFVMRQLETLGCALPSTQPTEGS